MGRSLQRKHHAISDSTTSPLASTVRLVGSLSFGQSLDPYPVIRPKSWSLFLSSSNLRSPHRHRTDDTRGHVAKTNQRRAKHLKQRVGRHQLPSFSDYFNLPHLSNHSLGLLHPENSLAQGLTNQFLSQSKKQPRPHQESEPRSQDRLRVLLSPSP